MVSGTIVEAPSRQPETVKRWNGQTPPPPPPPRGGGDGPHGEPTPRRPLIENVVLGTLVFIAAEIMFFAGLVSAFWVLRLASAVWPPPLQPRLPVGVTAINTLVLLASSGAMIAAWRAVRAGGRPGIAGWLRVAATLGGLFLLVQGYEWVRLVHFGLTLSSGAYGGTFYTLIGAHAAHVLGALAWLAATIALVARGRFDDGRVGGLKACAIYWHFVVALWPILWVSVYLL